jgi:hypothetical protein
MTFIRLEEIQSNNELELELGLSLAIIRIVCLSPPNQMSINIRVFHKYGNCSKTLSQVLNGYIYALRRTPPKNKRF